MAINDRTRIAIPIIVRITLIGAVAGALYGSYATTAAGGEALPGFERGLISGAIIGCILAGLNALVLDAPNAHRLRRAPFLAHIVLKAAIYLIVFVAATAFSQWVLPIPTAVGLHIGFGDVVFFFVVSFVISFLFDLNSLLGQNALLSFMTGRYFKPRIEERIFLIIDMKNSTAAAERLGEVGFHRLLNRFVDALTGPIVLRKGEIHKYVGDELIATWPLAAGLKDARCLSACFDAMRRLAELRPAFEREFGLSVAFRAGLHCGPVVVGEIGTVKKEIALSGDALNTAARIVDACRERKETVLASATLLRQLTIPPGIEARALPPVALRGKQSAVELLALRAAGAGVVSMEAAE